jgi:hypothetical protein
MDFPDNHILSDHPVFVVWRVSIENGKEKLKFGVITNNQDLSQEAVPDVYPLPSQEEILILTSGAKYITIIHATHFLSPVADPPIRV